MATLKALYILASTISGNTYIVNLETGAQQPIQTLDNPNASGYPVLQGSITVVSSKGESQSYNIPAGKTQFIYNALWPNSASSQESGSDVMNGLQRLFVNFNGDTSNTVISATSSAGVSIVGLGQPNDTAVMVHSVFPPQ
ncbi:MAG: hypothetical protein HWE14_03330 [Flavobacteriia bacterium]|nr:hypothetical protein [Flavobacteriia bacterium]